MKIPGQFSATIIMRAVLQAEVDWFPSQCSIRFVEPDTSHGDDFGMALSPPGQPAIRPTGYKKFIWLDFPTIEKEIAVAAQVYTEDAPVGIDKDVAR